MGRGQRSPSRPHGEAELRIRETTLLGIEANLLRRAGKQRKDRDKGAPVMIDEAIAFLNF